MGTQEFLEGVIEKTCSNKAEVESKTFNFCNEAIMNGYAKYKKQFPVDIFQDDFTLQVLCQVLHERTLLKKDMETISAERDAFKTKVDELKIAKRKEPATAAQQQIDELEEAVAYYQENLAKAVAEKDEQRNKALGWEALFEESKAIWKNELVEAMKRHNELVKTNQELEQQLASKLAELAQRKEASDKQRPDSSGEGGSDTEAPGDRQLVLRPAGEQRFTQVLVHVKKTYPEESLKVDRHREIHQQRKKDISDLNKRAAQLSEQHADTDGYDEDAVHQKLITIQQRIATKQKQQQHHFEIGCALAKELNSRPLTPAQIEALEKEDAGRQRISILVKRCNQEVVKQERERRVAARLK